MAKRWFKDDVTAYNITAGDFGGSETVTKASSSKGLYQQDRPSETEQFAADSQVKQSKVFFLSDPNITDHQYIKVVTQEGATHVGRVLTTQAEGRPGKKSLWIVVFEEHAAAPVDLP